MNAELLQQTAKMSATSVQRSILITLATLTLLSDLIWATTYKSRCVAYILASTVTDSVTDAKHYELMPLFDAMNNRWTVSDRQLTSLKTMLSHADPQELGPDSIRNFISVRLSEDANSGDVGRALLMISLEGICQVAVFEGEVFGSTEQFRSVRVFRIIDSRNGNRSVHCRDRVNIR